jgi:hypothetical protein
MVYFYCLGGAINADGQLSDVLLPAKQVKMDSSVPWDIVNVDAFKAEAVNPRQEQCSQLQKPQDGILNEGSSQETGLRCDDTDFLETAIVKHTQQLPSVEDLTASDDFMNPQMRRTESPVFDAFNLFDDDEKHLDRLQGELLALEEMLQSPHSDKNA